MPKTFDVAFNYALLKIANDIFRKFISLKMSKFQVGCDLSFAANGKCHVHLTGYLIEEFPELSEEEEVEEQSEEEVEKQPVKKKKRDNKISKNGRKIIWLMICKNNLNYYFLAPSKKTKVSSDSDNGEENSDSSDVNLEDLLQKSFDEDENDDTYVEEEDEDNGSDEVS